MQGIDRAEKTLDKMVENGGIMSPAMIEAGYSEAYAKNPQKLLKTQKFQELLDKIGLTEDFIVSALKQDIDAKPQKRVEELKLAAKIRRMVDVKDDTPRYQQNNFLVLPADTIDKYDIHQSTEADSTGSPQV